ncbi:NUDIX hydrolase [Mycobacterium sp. djl-10]|nr:NUDIX hydrolase [Mycobacterium sp. djl-10]
MAFRQYDDYGERVSRYDPTGYPPVAVTVDLVALTIRDDTLVAMVVRRGEQPFLDRWALPGGFVREGEDLDAAAARELYEETALPADRVHLEQLASYGAPQRDPRMRVVTVAYLGLAPDLPVPVAGGDAAGARWTPVAELLTSALAFDHNQILADGLERARAKLEYTPLATTFCAPQFTVAELRRVYEIVWGTTLDSRNFHRKVTGADGFLLPTGATTTRDGGRPAQLYRRGDLRLLHPPMLRAESVPKN